MKNTHIPIIISIIAISVVAFVFPANAQSIPTVTMDKPISEMSISELQAKISELTQAIQQLQALLLQLTGQAPDISGIPGAYIFNINLKHGTSSIDVKYLQIFLNADPDTQVSSTGAGSSGQESMYFGPKTKQAVIKFQEKYASEVLTPWNLTQGTGFVGQTTRDKINQLLEQYRSGAGDIPTPPTPEVECGPADNVCPSGCTYSQDPDCNRCGDNIIQTPNSEGIHEVCDANNLNNQTCIIRGYASGNLSCSNDCLTFNVSTCLLAGGGSPSSGGGGPSIAPDPGPACGPADNICPSGCTHSQDTDCTYCGDNIIQSPNNEGIDEVCDNTSLGGETCITKGFPGGDLACSSDCLIFNTADCTLPSPANDPPVLDPIGDKAVNENQELTFTITATDPNNDTLSYSVQDLASGASFNPSTQTFTWTSTYEQSGTYILTFIVSDGNLTDSEEITITVSNVNRAPSLNTIGNKSVNENQLLSFTISATDPDNDSLTYSIQGLILGATFEDQTFIWTPTYEQSGTYTFTFIVSDTELTDSEEITITVQDVCVPDTCSGLGYECNSWDDGCGSTLNCGTCESGYTCTNGQCIQDTPAPYCGDGQCNGTETCSICSQDCGICPTGNTYYLDAVNGDDSNLGTSAAPWKTMERAMSDHASDPNVDNGDTIYLRTGNYGAVTFDHSVTSTGWDDGFTYTAENGQNPVFTSINFTAAVDCDYYITFDGITVQDTNLPTSTGHLVWLQDVGYVKLLNMTFKGNGTTLSEDFTVTAVDGENPRTIFSISDAGGIAQAGRACWFMYHDTVLLIDSVDDLGGGTKQITLASALGADIQINDAVEITEDWTDAGITTRKVDYEAHYLLIDNCEFSYMAKPINISQNPKSGLVVSNNNIHHFTTTGISIGAVERNDAVVIEDNYLHDRMAIGRGHGSGIGVYSWPSVIVRRNRLHHAGGTSHLRLGGAGMDGDGFTSAVIENNLIYDPMTVTNVLLEDINSNLILRNNTFIARWRLPVTGTHVARYHGAVSVLLADNTHDHSTWKIHNNVFVGNLGINGTAEEIATIDEDKNIIWCFWSSAGLQSEITDSNTVVIVNSSNQIIDGYSADYFEVSGSFFRGGSAFDSHSFTVSADVDPDYGHAHGQDLGDSYALASGSDGIGFADATESPALDILGNTRDASPDAGAYEYQGGAQECAGTDTSCGTYPNCQNCDTDGGGEGDGCSGTSYRDYYCSGTSCVYTDYPSDPRCYVCNPNQTQSCDTGLQGVCNQGTQTCQSNGTWGSCIQNQETTAEICDDSLDNDCDGQTDCDDSDCSADPVCEVTFPTDYISYWEFEGNADDSGPGNNDGTLMGDAAIISDAEKGNVLSLDGDGDYVGCGNDISLQTDSDLTAIVWVRPSVGALTDRYIYGKGPYNAADAAFVFYYQNSDTLKFSVADQYLMAGSIAQNEWTFLAISYKKDSWGKVYQNGEFLGNLSGYTASLGTSHNLVIGAKYNGALPFDGAIDEVMIYDRALSESEIQDIYDAQKPAGHGAMLEPSEDQLAFNSLASILSAIRSTVQEILEKIKNLF